MTVWVAASPVYRRQRDVEPVPTPYQTSDGGKQCGAAKATISSGVDGRVVPKKRRKIEGVVPPERALAAAPDVGQLDCVIRAPGQAGVRGVDLGLDASDLGEVHCVCAIATRGEGERVERERGKRARASKESTREREDEHTLCG